jgi:hypothetical protein
MWGRFVKRTFRLSQKGLFFNTLHQSHIIPLIFRVKRPGQMYETLA